MGKNGNGQPDPALLSMVGLVFDMAQHPANALGYALIWLYALVYQPDEKAFGGNGSKLKARKAVDELLVAFDHLSEAFHKDETGADKWDEEQYRKHKETCGCANAYSSHEIRDFAAFMASRAGQPLEGSKNAAFQGPVDPEQLYIAARKAQELAVDPAVDDEFARMLRDLEDEGH